MKLNQALALGSVFVGLVATTHATNARVESMGKNTNFIMDDISIFDNPANVGIYPNHLIGGFGNLTEEDVLNNITDPQNPQFGGIFALGIGADTDRDPKFLIGGLLNRKDALLGYLPDQVIVPIEGLASQSEQIAVPTTVTNIDGFLGLSTESGNLFGAHIYTAVQDGISDDGTVDPRFYASVLRFDLGTNFSFNEDIDWEISAGVNRLHFGADDSDFFDVGEFGYSVETRMFSTLAALNGELVPHLQYDYIQTFGRENTNLSMGLGVNVGMERGFFWLGVDYINFEEITEGWTKDEVTGSVTADQHPNNENEYGNDFRTETGAVVSFGIERNIWVDWFVIRVGGQKKISWVECSPAEAEDSRFDTSFCGESGAYMSTNPVGNGTLEDHLGFGIGINIEEKLKVDATLAEDLLFRNPFDGAPRFVSRISATYSF